ncbi:hypothetical protein [uncultured Subdoligranulum sp.]|uniref:phage tail protein n=1 Tax=uncultured Subdoligranulum sp. TaxID=512298 RepID=UPI0025D2787C|nr:hypothetical protein [uncultured Subdoligranulum sp.]
MAENGTTLAKAYVQIMPSAQGIKGNLAEALGGDAASVGQSWGQKLAGSIKGVITAAGIGAALGKALTEGAALEQSIGGVETLFKGSADRVIAAADNAYRTAGVSANSYMEQVTSFSATLLQGLGGDTEAAASYADKAIVQMADNANKMGTDMSAIQYAYQGFAKDNYTMLDNLKLGYGGTQAEMARLINDSGVLGDSIQVTAETVKDVPFSSIIDAIGVIQDDLGITGTTAQEAATTLSGSFASMKAAASNVLADLTLGRDIQPALNGLAQTVTTFLIGNLIPAVGNILSALPGALVTFVQTLGPQMAAGLATLLPQAMAALSQAGPQMMAAARTMLTSFQTAVTTQLPVLLQSGVQMVQQLVAGAVQGLPALLAQASSMVGQFSSTFLVACVQLLTAGMQIVSTLVNGVVQSLPSLLTTAGTLMTQFYTSVLSALPQLLQAGVQMVLQVVQGVVSNLPQIVTTAFQVILQFAAGILQQLPQILQTGISLIGQLVAGLIQAIPQVIAAIPQIISGIVDTFLSYDWLSIGGNIIQGIANGIASGVGVIIDAAKSAASAALNAAKEFLGIASPSKVMRDQVGQFIPAGIAEGISRNLAPLRSAMQQATDIVAARLPDPALAFDAARWQPAFAGPGGAVGGSPQQTFIFNQPVQTPDEFARAVRVQQTYGLAGGR